MELLRHSSASAGIRWVITQRMEKKQLKEQKEKNHRLWFCNIKALPATSHQCKTPGFVCLDEENFPR